MRKVDVSAGVLILTAVSVLVLPLRMIICTVIAVSVHELAHLAVLWLLGCPVFGITIGVRGARIRTSELTPLQEFFCAGAGPAGSLLLLSLGGAVPMIAAIGLIQGLFNLLPVYPLDGGRMLRAAFCSWFPERGEFLSDVIGISILLTIMSFAGCILGSVWPLVFGALWLFRTGKIKIPCKAAPKGLQ